NTSAFPGRTTVRESFPSHGSSKSFAARILKFISSAASLPSAKLPLGFLLVAVEVYQFPVATHVRAAHDSRYGMMAMKLFPVDEIHATESTEPSLVVGHVQVPRGNDETP